MAENPYVNKVEYAGQTLMDLTGDTVTPSDVLSGITFHDRSGSPQTGNLITHDVYDGLDSTSTSDALSAKQGKVLNDKITPSGLKNGNIDTYFTSDVVWIQAVNSSGTQPGFNYYTLEIISNENGQIVQRATHIITGATATRIYANGSWGSWAATVVKSEMEPEYFNLTFNVAASDIIFTNENNWYNPATKIAHIEFIINTAKNKMPTSGLAIATIPNKYRPYFSEVYTMAFVDNDGNNNVWQPPKMERVRIEKSTSKIFGNNFILGRSYSTVMWMSTEYIAVGS